MLESLTLGLFCLGLFTCIFTGHSIVLALIFGFCVFTGYGLLKGIGFKDLLKSALQGVRKVWKITLVMLLIGALTASWRASGTVAYIVSFAAEYIRPEIALLSAFLLNGMFSTLTGTSFGTVATMGVITMTLLTVMGYPVWLAGGTILAGVFVGDRCSPVSTSALLVCTVTQTEIYKNVALMVRTAVIPFVLASIAYLVIGFWIDSKEATLDIGKVFSEDFVLNFWTTIPAWVLIICIAFRRDIGITMILSLLSSIPVCVWLQGMDAWEFCLTVIRGFQTANEKVGVMLNGGGILSMVEVAEIVLISSTFSGLFERTGLINGIRHFIAMAARRISSFGAVVLTAVVTVGVACNQALPIMLTQQLCKDIVPDRQRLAIDIENSTVVIAPLVPWCIAGAIPLAIIGAPTASIPFAVYLWLLPLWGLIAQGARQKQNW